MNLIHSMVSAARSPLKHDHWAFLEQVDAPQWVDLELEAALMGTEGDDPWFHQSHPHHEKSIARVVNTLPSATTVSRDKSRLISSTKSTNLRAKPSVKGLSQQTRAGLKEDSCDSLTKLGFEKPWSRSQTKLVQLPQDKKFPDAIRPSVRLGVLPKRETGQRSHEGTIMSDLGTRKSILSFLKHRVGDSPVDENVAQKPCGEGVKQQHSKFGPGLDTIDSPCDFWSFDDSPGVSTASEQEESKSITCENIGVDSVAFHANQRASSSSYTDNSDPGKLTQNAPSLAYVDQQMLEDYAILKAELCRQAEESATSIMGTPVPDSSGFDESVPNQDLVKSEKLHGAQSTHPVIEKLRKSWGSALRVKQRKAAEVLAASKSDNPTQNSGGHAADSAAHRSPPSDVMKALVRISAVRESAVDMKDAVPKMGTQSEPSSYPRRQTLGVQDAHCTKTKVRSSLKHSKSLGFLDSKTQKAMAGRTAQKTDLQKLHKPVTVVNRISGCAPSKGNKENLSLELGSESPTRSLKKLQFSEFDHRKRIRNNALRASLPSSGSVKLAAQPLDFPYGDSPSDGTRSVVSSKIGSGWRSSRKSSETHVNVCGHNLEPIDPSSEDPNNKLLRAVPRSTALLPSVSLKKSRAISKDSIISGHKTSKSEELADEGSVTLAKQERKVRPTKYEPRMHSGKVIREWESKSGQHYYDLLPGEREKVNQEIAAMKHG